MAELSTLARPYAEAAFEVALANNALGRWAEEMALLDQVCSDAKMALVLTRPSLSGDKKAGLLLEVCGDELSAPVQNFVRVLVENKRIALLGNILAQFNKMKAEQEKTQNVRVLTAHALDAETEAKLVQGLSKRLQREVSIQVEIDKSLIGGIVIYAGDTVIDGSVKGKISKLAEAMKS